MGRFEYCESIVAREYDHFEEVNALNIAAITRFSSLVILTLLFLSKNGFLAQIFRRIGIHLSILPSYFDYIIALIITYFIFGVFAGVGGKLRKLPIVIAVETGISRMFAEGLAFFLMQYGAGYYGLRKATLYSSIWGLVVIGVSILIAYSDGKNDNKTDQGENQEALIGRLILYSCITVFYLIIVLSPLEWIYRRPAFATFGYFQIFSALNYLVVIICLWLKYDLGYCFLFGVTTIIDGIGFPIVVFLSLALDSEFWQGIGKNMSTNPLAGVWNLEIDTIQTMGQKLADIESSDSFRKLPIIHFGFIELDEHLGYVAGGLSRVYFGKIKKISVAVKILFAMELTPEVVTAFYNEIQILYSLQHPNVITCLGISVMPPAVCVILEYCKNGSLYDYLHKPIKTGAVDMDIGNIPSSNKKSFEQSTTEMSNIPKKMEQQQQQQHIIDNDSQGNSGTNTTTPVTIQKRPSRPTNPDDHMAQKRGSRTLDELLAKKRGSRPTEELTNATSPLPSTTTPSTSITPTSTLPKMTSIDMKVGDESHGIHNPLRGISVGGIGGGSGVGGGDAPVHSLSTTSPSHPSNGLVSTDERMSWMDKKTNFIERASSVVDNLFGKTPNERPSIQIDSERFSTSHNDRIKLIIDGRSHHHSTQETTSTDIRHSLSSNISHPSSLPGTYTKSLFSFTKPKIKESEVRYLTWEEKFEMIVGTCRGLSFLHEKGYMHCDLKSPNFLVSDDKIIKLADLGEAREIDQSKQLLSLPNPALNWRPPEMMDPNISLRFYTTASDVYSLAMVISEILNQEIPLDDVFQNLTFEECYQRLVEFNYRPPIPDFVPEEFALTLQRAWHTDPIRRPSCRDLTAVAERALSIIQLNNPIIAQIGTSTNNSRSHHHYNSSFRGPSSCSQQSVTEL